MKKLPVIVGVCRDNKVCNLGVKRSPQGYRVYCSCTGGGVDIKVCPLISRVISVAVKCLIMMYGLNLKINNEAFYFNCTKTKHIEGLSFDTICKRII